MSNVRIAGVLILGTLLCAFAAQSLLAGGTPPPTTPPPTTPPPTTPPPTTPPPMPPPTPLVIEWFTCDFESGTLWTFYGQVQDYDDSTSITINFSGLPSLEGQSVQVNPDGSFSLTVLLGEGETGMATAQAVDSEGAISDDAYTFVD
jgi:hypothetical protein